MNWKKKTIMIYAFGGLVLGIVAGIMMVNDAEEKQKEVDFSVKNGAKVGIAALNFIKKNILG